MILTPEERRALLGLVALLLLGQGAAFLRDEQRARPDRELSTWLTRAQAARAESLGSGSAQAGVLGALGPLVRAILPDSMSASAGADPAGAPRPGEAPGSKTGVVPGAERAAASPANDAGPKMVPVEPASRIPAGVAATGRIAINQASAKDLEALPGVGPSLANRIVEERERAGPFRSARDLMRVKGIGPKKLEAIRDRVEF